MTWRLAGTLAANKISRPMSKMQEYFGQASSARLVEEITILLRLLLQLTSHITCTSWGSYDALLINAMTYTEGIVHHFSMVLQNQINVGSSEAYSGYVGLVPARRQCDSEAHHMVGTLD